MPKIKLEVLTPVHIGSGNFLAEDTEFITFSENNESIIAIIDDEKILEIIGKENIDKWTDIIANKKGLKQYLLQREKKLSSNDLDKRTLVVYGNGTRTIKEQLHDGLQKPYIPGSSIKGAIRTTVLAQKILSDKHITKNNLKNRKGKFSAQEIEKKTFGSDANKDVFRFLLPGDAYFDYETIAINANTLNLQGNGWEFKKGHGQLVECIPDGAETTFKLKINSALLEKNKDRNTIYSDTDFLSLNKLFPIINKHTLSLLVKELDFWNDENIKEEIFDEYIENLNNLIGISKRCKENEAVLRIGYGSGWSFITGGWAKEKEILSNYEYEQFMSVVRRKKYADHIPFPKTRKIDEYGDMLGFVKLISEQLTPGNQDTY